MAVLIGTDAHTATGTLAAHSNVFQSVANTNKSVVASRAVGKYATGLLRDGYATKGFHNKAKSCNWGPMAGFVLSDPRFTKRGDSREAMEEQRRDLFKAFKGGAGEVPVYITETRLSELLRPPLGTMRLAWETDYHNRYYFANSPSGTPYLFHLTRVEGVPGAHGKPLWRVEYAYTEKALPSKLSSPSVSKDLTFLPVMAVVDTATRPSVVGTYLSATTGDYDLFAVFGQRHGANKFDQHAKDKRQVPGTERFKAPIGKFIEHEDEHKGNLTPRIQKIMNEVNSLANHPGGMLVHHSDEAGRPMINDIDFPFIAWVPDAAAPYSASSVGDFKAFIALLGGRYVLALNPGWLRQLGVGVSPGGSYEV